MSQKTPITVAHGDGIGPEIMAATLLILSEAGARIDIETIEIGEKVYLRGCGSGIEPEAWESLRRTRVFLKAPITTPQGGGYKSLNVATRKALGLYANVRPCVAYHPFVQTKHPKMDVVIVRENEEDLYAGIEYRQSDDVYQALKIISRPGTERTVRYAFEYAMQHNRKKVTCFTKDNILKMSDGLFRRVFDEVGAQYPGLEKEHWIIDIGAAKLADTPEAFDVVVLPNMYGDILSDVAAQIAGSVGLAGSANIGDQCAMFEAIHGSAPRRAGQNVANPSGLLLGAVMMLLHIGQPDVAERVHNAWLCTIEDGVHTYDIYTEGVSNQKVGTTGFARAVVERLGQQPKRLRAVRYQPVSGQMSMAGAIPRPHARKELGGVDVFIHWRGSSVKQLGEQIQSLGGRDFRLSMISNRGVRVYPDGFPETFCVDHWQCRFLAREEGAVITHAQIVALLQRISNAGLDYTKTENLYTFDGKPGYSLDEDD